MNEEEYLKIWEELLRRRGFGKFEQIETKKGRFLRTNYNVHEPDGSQRNETWILDSKGSISPLDILTYNGYVRKLGADYGVLLTPGTLTSSAVLVLNESAPCVRVYDHTKFIKLLGEETDIASKYNVSIEESLIEPARSFMKGIEECPPGKETWKEYQDLIEGIFAYLFVPPLGKPEWQSRAEDGLEIRDVVFPNLITDGFWEYIRTEYKGSYVVVEAKNIAESNKDDVIQLCDYLNPNQLGLFGILCSRGISGSAEEQRRKAYSTDPHKMIVLLSDNDVREMIHKKSRRENPVDVLRDRIDFYRIHFRF